MNIPFLDLKKVNEPYAEQMRQAVSDVINSGRYIGGEVCVSFETKLAKKTGTDFCVGVSNGLDALRLIIEGYKVMGKLNIGDEIIVPSNTYVATVLAITHAGLKPVLVEPDINTLNIDSSRIEEAVTEHTRAIMTVHLYGRTAYDHVMADVATRHGLLVIEDNAQAIGAEADVMGFGGKSNVTGGLGHAAAFSFYPTKNIGAAGDAGAVTTSDRDLADAVRAISNYGSDRRYHNIYHGFNCRLDPIQAAILSVKLDHLEEICNYRRQLASLYDSLLNPDSIVKPRIPENERTHVWHQYVVLADKRDALREALASKGIGTDINYPCAPHRQPCYADTLGMNDYPIADYISSHCLSLPLSTALTTEQAEQVAKAVNEF